MMPFGATCTVLDAVLACCEGSQRAISTTRNNTRATASQHAKTRSETMQVEPSNPQSKNMPHHSTPPAPFWTLFWRDTKAHSAPYRPHGIPREPQSAITRKPGQKRCTWSRAILDQRTCHTIPRHVHLFGRYFGVPRKHTARHINHTE